MGLLDSRLPRHSYTFQSSHKHSSLSYLLPTLQLQAHVMGSPSPRYSPSYYPSIFTMLALATLVIVYLSSTSHLLLFSYCLLLCSILCLSLSPPLFCSTLLFFLPLCSPHPSLFLSWQTIKTLTIPRSTHVSSFFTTPLAHNDFQILFSYSSLIPCPYLGITRTIRVI